MQKCFVVALVATFTVAVSLHPVRAEMLNASATQSTESFKCELTKANGRYLPDSPVPGRGSDYYGNDSIAIGVGSEGLTITFQPGGSGFVLPDGSLQWKFLWAKARLPMTIEGRRLDASAPPLRSRVNHEFDDDRFQPSSLVFPTPGCWEVTSRVGQSTLTFVIKVVKIGEGPSTDPEVRKREAMERMRLAAPDPGDIVNRLFPK